MVVRCRRSYLVLSIGTSRLNAACKLYVSVIVVHLEGQVIVRLREYIRSRGKVAWLVGDIADKRCDGYRVAVDLFRQPHHHRIFLRHELGARSSQRVSVKLVNSLVASVSCTRWFQVVHSNRSRSCVASNCKAVDVRCRRAANNRARAVEQWHSRHQR